MHAIDGAFSASSWLATVIFGKNAQYFSIFSEKLPKIWKKSCSVFSVVWIWLKHTKIWWTTTKC